MSNEHLENTPKYCLRRDQGLAHVCKDHSKKSLVTILKPPATMVLKGTVIIRTEIVVFIRSRKWPAVMVREGVTSGFWEIY